MKRIPILALMMLGGCLAGCATMNAEWQVDEAQMSTQFEFSWGTTIKIGFPGTFRGHAKGAGETQPDEPTE